MGGGDDWADAIASAYGTESTKVPDTPSQPSQPTQTAQPQAQLVAGAQQPSSATATVATVAAPHNVPHVDLTAALHAFDTPTPPPSAGAGSVQMEGEKRASHERMTPEKFLLLLRQAAQWQEDGLVR